MRTLYFSIAGGLTVVALGMLGWNKREKIKSSFNMGVPKAKAVARSAWGRIAKAADNIVHTERDPQIAN